MEYIGYHEKDVPMNNYDPVMGAKVNIHSSPWGCFQLNLTVEKKSTVRLRRSAALQSIDPILAVVKNGVRVFHLHLGGILDGVRRYTVAPIVFNTAAMMIAVFLVDLLQCVSVTKVFYPDAPGSWINDAAFFISTAALTIVTNLMVLIIPMWIVARLQMRLHKKLAIIFMLSRGLM